jgi:precorrin-6B methylase 1
MTEPPTGRGSLACVGLGITLGSHLSPLARARIEQADVVFAGVSDALVEAWLSRMHGDVRSLQVYYREGRSRRDTYRDMVEVMLAEVRDGRRVCGAFYGHPGVYAWAPHKAIAQARAEGFSAHMEPAISAADCFYADLGVDPGTCGLQSFEASQFMLYRRQVDTAAWLLLWQVAAAGDLSHARRVSGPELRAVLVCVLQRHYPDGHEVVVYRAATLPFQQPRIERATVATLAGIAIDPEDLVAIPPLRPPTPDLGIRRQLEALGRT